MARRQTPDTKSRTDSRRYQALAHLLDGQIRASRPILLQYARRTQGQSSGTSGCKQLCRRHKSPAEFWREFRSGAVHRGGELTSNCDKSWGQISSSRLCESFALGVAPGAARTRRSRRHAYRDSARQYDLEHRLGCGLRRRCRFRGRIHLNECDGFRRCRARRSRACLGSQPILPLRQRSPR